MFPLRARAGFSYPLTGFVGLICGQMCAVGETLRCGSLSLLRAFTVQNAQCPADASRRLADPGRTEKRLQEERSNRSCPIRSGPAVDTSGRTTGIRDTAAHSSDSRKADPFEFLQ